VFFELHPDFFLLRIESRRKLFFKEGLKEAFILYHATPPHPLANKFFIAARFQVLSDMLTSVTLLSPLFGWLLAR
jgi:hypothetical protein